MSITHVLPSSPRNRFGPEHMLAVLAAGLVMLGGCAQVNTPAAAPATQVQPLQQYMTEAAQAAAGGSKERSRELYRTAAKNYPTSKEPWLKLAEDHFEAGNYGQAILAAQEVMQRDPADSLATSVLAVSGLRVSAMALTALRQQKNALTGGTRSEAEGLAKALREALGEPVLVPRPVPGSAGAAAAAAAGGASAPAAAPAPAPRARPVRPLPRAAAAPGTAPAAAPAPAAPPPPPPKSTPPDNPFNVLKK